MPPKHRRVYDLFVLNIALQLFDAVATYQGLQLGCREANPILANAFGLFGVGPALLMFKANACGLLFLLSRNWMHHFAAPALAIVAAAYSVLSLVPWLAKFLIFLARAI
jgi:hypothetical protein